MEFFDQLQQQTSAEREYLLAAPIIHSALAGTATRAQYIAFLTQAYHHVKHTVPLLMACGARLPERLEWLREAIAEYIEEEIGHQEWILNDIRACGGDAELQAAVERVNASLPDYARVHQWLRADAPFSASNGLATVNGRLRRNVLFDHYQSAINAFQP